ncbi:MAG: DedA family protein [Flavobacteriaceae bacterium]|jgi:membrane protein YqaA with SNARE-associated domain|nr:DedA family protein [Flavobacteriaceae bacterium]
MLESLIEYGYFGLFLASFLAATILPFSSEVVLAGMLFMGGDPLISIIVASLGNWSGGMVNYFLGKLGKVEWIEKYLKVKHEKVNKMRRYLDGKGASIAFFSFLPVIGDMIPIALGYMRANIYIVSVSMFTGKMLRYLVIMYGVDWFK